MFIYLNASCGGIFIMTQSYAARANATNFYSVPLHSSCAFTSQFSSFAMLE